MSQDNTSRDNVDNNLSNNQKIKNRDNLIAVKEANENKMKNNAQNTLDNSYGKYNEKTKFWFRIISCPCYFVYNLFGCFCDDRCQSEPYYQTGLFKDNVIFCILSLIDMILVIIYKGKLSIAFFVIRLISDSFGILICLLAIGLWSEEATDEDHMDPACCFGTVCENVITVGLDITSIVLFFISDFKNNIILLISLIVHLVFPIIFPFLIYFCDILKDK